MFIPVVNLVMFLWFAFSKWPVLEFVDKDWKIKQLQLEKDKLEQRISKLSESPNQDQPVNELGESQNQAVEKPSLGKESTSFSGLKSPTQRLETDGSTDKGMSWLLFIFILAIIVGIVVLVITSG